MSAVIQDIGTFATLLSGVAAGGALLINATRAPLLRRRAKTLQKAINIEAGRPQQVLLKDIHRATIAQLVSIQLYPTRLFVGPFFFWLVAAALAANLENNLLFYAESASSSAYSTFSTAEFGGSALFIAPFIPVLILMAVLTSNLHSVTVFERRRAMYNYYCGLSVERPAAPPRIFVDLIDGWVPSLIGGISTLLAAAGAGGFVGSFYHSFGTQQTPRIVQADATVIAVTALIFSLGLTGVAFGSIRRQSILDSVQLPNHISASDKNRPDPGLL